MTELYAGAHRVEARLAFEAEFDVLDSSTVEWGLQDQFFVYDGYAYYYKPWLEEYLQEDINMVSTETVNGVHTRKPVYDEIVKFLGYEVPGMTSKSNLDFMKEMISKNPPGLPEFVVETPMFFQFKLDGTHLQNLTIDDIDTNIIDNIKKYVTGDYNPFLTPYFAQSLYRTENRYYCMDVLAYYYNPKAQFGMFMYPTESSKYPDAKNNSYFFTFKDINEEEQEFVKLLGKLHTDYTDDPITVEYNK